MDKGRLEIFHNFFQQIMLGLTSHEAHFSLLREEVRFGGKKTQR